MWNPESTGVESGIQDSLGLPYMGRIVKSYYGPLGTGHYLPGGWGEGYYVLGEGHNFFSLTLGRAVFLKMTLRGGLRIF